MVQKIVQIIFSFLITLLIAKQQIAHPPTVVKTPENPVIPTYVSPSVSMPKPEITPPPAAPLYVVPAPIPTPLIIVPPPPPPPPSSEPSSGFSPPPPPVDPWVQIESNDIAVVHASVSGGASWSTPRRLEVSDANWEDGIFMSFDGSKIYFTYYPDVDFIAATKSGNYTGTLDVYVSNSPFTTKQKLTSFFLSEPVWSEGGVMVTPSGDFFYNSNRDYQNDMKADDDIYMNSTRLAFNDDGWAGNPHYCTATDELYFDEQDTRIWVLQDAKKNNFAGTPQVLDAPINVSGKIAAQPFLTADCSVMYFLGSGSTGPTVMRSVRQGMTWSAPQVFISSQTGVGEFTMNASETKGTFVQLFKAPDGTITSQIMYIER